MATFLSKEYNACLIPEIARDFISNLKRPYQAHDVLHMASLQFQAQLNHVDCPLMISDTSLLNYLIWMEVKYGYVHPQIQEWFFLQQIDGYILLAPDLEWEEDPLRENPLRLDELFEMYRTKLTELEVPFFIIKGIGNQRNERAREALEHLIVDKF